MVTTLTTLASIFFRICQIVNIYEMSSSYTWCNSIRVIHFLSHRFSKDLTVKKKTSSFFISLNAYLINSILIISLLIKYFFVFFFFSLHFLCFVLFFLPLNKTSITFLIFFRRIFTGSCKSFILYSVCIAFFFFPGFIQSAGSLFLLSI